MDNSFDFSLDDLDWSTPPASTEPVGSPPPGAASPEEPPPPEPAPEAAPGRERSYNKYNIPPEMLPKAAREYKGDQYKRKRFGGTTDFSLDDLDWGGGEVTAAPAYNPASDFDITRGFKAGAQGAEDSIKSVGDMAKIALLPEAEQRTAMIEFGKRAPAAGDVVLQEPDIRNVEGFGDAWTWLMESAGQMAGSMYGAAKTGGVAGAATGGALGASAGSAVPGVGTVGGGVAGAVTGGAWGTYGAFGVMGVGGMFNDLLRDEDIQAGLADGTISPAQIHSWAALGGSVIGALDAVPAASLIKRATGDVGTAAVKKTLKEYIKAGVKGGVRSALEEGVTEAGQGAISEFGQGVLSGDPDLTERAWSVINQGLAGAVGGGTAGAGGGVYRHARTPGVANPAVPAGEEDPPEDPANVPHGPAGGTGNPPVPPRQPARRPGEDYSKTRPPVGAPTQRADGLDPTLAAGLGVEDEEELEIDEEEVGEFDEEGEFAAPAPTAIRRPNPQAKPASPIEDVTLAAGLESEAPPVAAQAQQQPQQQPQPANQNLPTPQVLPGAAPQANLAEGEPAADLQTPPPAGPSLQKQTAMKAQQARIAAQNAAGARPGPGEYTQQAETPLADDLEVAEAEVEAEQPSGFIEAPLNRHGQPYNSIREIDADGQRMVSEQMKRRDLLDGKKKDLMAYAKERGLTWQAMRRLLEQNYASAEATLQELRAYINSEEGRAREEEEHARASNIKFEEAPIDAEFEEETDDFVPEQVAEPVAVVEEVVVESAAQTPRKRRDAIARFARNINRIVEAADQALGELELNPKPRPLSEDGPTAFKKGSVAPTKRQLKKRETDEAEYEQELEAYENALENYLDVAVPGRTALQDAVDKYNQLEGDEQQHYVRSLDRAVLSKLRSIADAYPDMGEPTPPVWGTRPRPTNRKGDKFKRKQQAKPEKRGRAVEVQPEEEEALATFTPTTVSKRVRVTPSMTAKLRAKHELEAEEVEPIVKKDEVIDFADVTAIPLLREQNKRFAKMTDAQIRGQDAYKNKRSPEWQAMTKAALAKMGHKPAPAPRAGVTKQEGGAKTARAALVSMLSKARDSGQKVVVRTGKALRRVAEVKAVSADGVVTFTTTTREPMDVDEMFDKYIVDIEGVEQIEKLPPIQVRKTVVDRAVAAMQKHFASKDSPVKLKPLGFSDEEIAGLEAKGMAGKKAMTKAEFGRWYQSVKGAAVPEGIGPEATGITPKQYNFPTLRAEYVDSEAASRMSFEEWQKQRKAAAEAPFERKVPELPKGRVAVRKVGVATQETAAVLASKTGMVGARGKTAVPVVRESAKRNPPKKAIPQKEPGWKGRHYLEGKPLSSDAKAEALARKDEPEGMLQKDIEYALPDVLKAQGVSAELSQTQIEEAAEKAAKAMVDRILKDRFAPLVAARELIMAGLKKAVAAYKQGDKDALKRLAKNKAIQDAKANLWRIEDKAEADLKSRTGPKTGKKTSVAIAGESLDRQRIRAKEEAQKPADERDPILMEMAVYFRQLAEDRKKQTKAAKVMRASRLEKIANLQKQRIANAKAFEKRQDKMAAVVAARKAMEAANFETYKKEWQALGVPIAEIEEFEFDKEKAQQWRLRNERALLSTPTLRKTISQLPVPKLPKKATPREEQTWLASIDAWAKEWVVAARAALAKEKLKLNNKISSRNNTPEENVLIYVDQIVDDWKIIDENLAKGRPLTKLQLKQRGMGTYDLWTAVNLIFRKPDYKLTEAQRVMQRFNDEQMLIAHITDASKTAAAQMDENELKSAALSAAEHEQSKYIDTAAPKGARTSDTDTNLRVDTTMGAAMFEALEKKGVKRFFSPPSEEQLPLGQEPETTTARQAMDKYMRGWKARGKLSGWQNLMRRALMKSLKKLVGDMPVHFVDASVIASHGGGQRHGLFVREKGKSFILLDKGLKGRPRLLDEILLHELSHGATAYAIDTNLHGTKDIIRALMNSLQAQLRDGALTENEAYVFENEHEFLAQAMNNAQVQEMMASLAVPVKLRAAIRALGAGRPMANYWDVMVAAVEHAISMFTPGRAGASYIDSVLKIYPHVALSSREQMADAEIRLKGKDIEDLTLGSPLDLAAFFENGKARTGRWLHDKSIDWRPTGQRILNTIVTSTNTMRGRVAKNIFGGNFDNPFNRLVDQLETLQRNIELMMRPADQMDDAIRRWMLTDSAANRQHVAELHDLVVNADLDDVDASVPLAQNTWIWDDANHPTKKPRTKPSWRHERDAGKRAAHARYHARWNALPAELRALAKPRLKYMQKQMHDYESRMVRGFLDRLLDAKNSTYFMPPGMGREDAVKEIMTGKMSPELKTALGKNAGTIAALGKFGKAHGMYAPASRMGKYFISGRVKIPTPSAPNGTVLFDDEAHTNQKVFRFVFDNLKDATDYVRRMGGSGEQRVISFKTKHINPLTGAFVPADEVVKDPNDPSIYHKAQPVYYVTLQDRYMAMSDTPSELSTQRQALIDSGEFDEDNISQPMLLEQHRNAVDTMPLQLTQMINNIQSQSSEYSEEEKSNAIAMLTHHFIRTQQGNRLTKRMIHRKGVAGFETGADEMFSAFHSHNEMMSRHMVAQDRIPAIDKARAELKAFMDAMRFGRRPEDLIALPLDQRQLLTRGYGKDQAQLLLRLDEDITEINKRLKSAATAGNFRGEQLVNAVQSLTTLNYLAKPIYFAFNAISIPMFTWPNMAGVMAEQHGAIKGPLMAARYLSKGMADIGISSIIGKSLMETGAEIKQFAEGFLPRDDYLREGRPVRRAFDFVEHIVSKLEAAGTPRIGAKKRAVHIAFMRQAAGQAGLDQPNLRMDLQKAGSLNKFYRGVEQSTRIFRALQEGIENINRIAPLLGYVDYFMDMGHSEEQAAQMAVHEMSREQVNYAKTNWPRWIGHPVGATLGMFKKFAMQQAETYYRSLNMAINPKNPGERTRALVHLGTTALIMWAIGGMVGNPLWEPIRYLMYMLGAVGFPVPETWDEAKTKGEKAMAGVIGDRAAETVMYGPLRNLGIDLSSRAALDSVLFYQQPEEQTREAWYAIIGQAAAGAGGSMFFDAAGKLSSFFDSDDSWPKWLSQLPAPGFIKDALKAYDSMANGPSTATGVKTGEPTGVLSGIAQALGVRTREQARPFEQGSAAKSREKERISREKSALMRRLNANPNAGASYRLINEWNQAHPEKEYRINSKSLRDARKRRRDIERDIAEQNAEAM